MVGVTVTTPPDPPIDTTPPDNPCPPDTCVTVVADPNAPIDPAPPSDEPCPPDFCVTVVAVPNPPLAPCDPGPPPPPPPPPPSADTAKKEAAAEAQAKANIAKYASANPKGIQATAGLTIYPDCIDQNHSCSYFLDSASAGDKRPGQYYVWEHQTSDVSGGMQVGQQNFVTPNLLGEAFIGHFPDDLGGSNLDTYRFFTISTNKTYKDSEQSPVLIKEQGQTIGFEHIFSTGGAVYINGSTDLTAHACP